MTSQLKASCANCGHVLVWMPHLPGQKYVWVHANPGRCKYPEPVLPLDPPTWWERYAVDLAWFTFLCVVLFILLTSNW